LRGKIDGKLYFLYKNWIILLSWFFGYFINLASVYNESNEFRGIKMKSKLIICLVIVVLLAGCAGSKAVAGTGVDTSVQNFSDVTTKDWKLIELYINGVNSNFSRDNQPNQLSRDIFSLKLEDGTISGTGAPNRYSGRYTLNDNQGISITPLLSTLMASIFEPENLREHDFFSYIQNTSTWSLSNNGANLELISVNSDNNPVRMIFAL